MISSTPVQRNICYSQRVVQRTRTVSRVLTASASTWRCAVMPRVMTIVVTAVTSSTVHHLAPLVSSALLCYNCSNNANVINVF